MVGLPGAIEGKAESIEAEKGETLAEAGLASKRGCDVIS